MIAPCRDTVLRLAAQGEGHQRIQAAIKREGAAGSANAVYQYVLGQGHALAGDALSDDGSAGQGDARPRGMGYTGFPAAPAIDA